MAIPTYVSSSVENQEPNKIIIVLSEAVESSIDTTGFVVSINSGANVVSSLVTVNNEIKITLSVDVIDTDSLTVDYTGGSDIVSVSDASALAIFTAKIITNNVFANIYNADPTLLTGAYDTNGNIDIIYNAGDKYTKINPHQLQTPSILRTALQEADLYILGDRRGSWATIKAARDSILASL